MSVLRHHERKWPKNSFKEITETVIERITNTISLLKQRKQGVRASGLMTRQRFVKPETLH